MRQELKIFPALLILIFLNSCSALRKGKTETDGGVLGNIEYRAILERVEGNNVTDEGFIVRKGRIELEGSALSGSYTLNVRYTRKGDLSASVRGPLGIEIVRLLSIEGRIYLVDRLGKTVYTGNTKEVLGKYGLPENVIAIIFGDLTGEGKETYSSIGRERMIIKGVQQGMEKVLSICISEEKVCEEIYRDLSTGNEVKLKYEGFKSDGSKKYASKIDLYIKKSDLKIGLKIDDFSSGYDEEIRFEMPSYNVRSL